MIQAATAPRGIDTARSISRDQDAQDAGALRRRSSRGRIVAVLLLGASALLGACSSGANPGAMTASLSEATLLPETSRLRQSVTMGAVTGGEQTSPLWKSKVSNEDFAEALRRSLAVHAMLASGAGAYRLEAQLTELDQPFAGFSMEVKATVLYRLVELRTNRVVFERPISNAYTAPFGSSLVAVTRLRLANEGAVRENIQAFLGALIAEERANPASFGVPMSELVPQIRQLLPAAS